MTSKRTVAYRRVMRTVRGLDAPALSAAEQDSIRQAADALLFCHDVGAADVRLALAEVGALLDELVDAERWAARRARQLLDDIWACGPEVMADVPHAA